MSVVAATAALLLTAAACSSGTSSESPSDAVKPTVTLGIPVDAAVYIPFYLARELGFFDEAGVNVDWRDNVGANATTQLASGQLDVIAYGTSAALPIIDQGRSVNAIYGVLYKVPQGLAVLEDSSVNSVDDLAGKAVASIGATGSNAGFANIVNNYLESKGLAPFTVVNVNDTGGLTSILDSGQVDAVVTAYEAATQISSGRWRLLYAGQNADPILPGLDDTAVSTSALALPPADDAKTEALARFTAALQAASEWASKATTDQIVQELQKVPAFADQDSQVVADNVNFYKNAFDGDAAGRITEDDWKSTLGVIDNFGLGLNLTDPKFGYDSVVNMTPLDQAEKLNITFTPNP